MVLAFGLPVNPVLGTNTLSTEWEPDYGQCLRQRYGVEFRRVTGCVGTKSEFAYYDSYNAVSEAAIKQKFGHDVFEECIYVACKRLGGTHPTAKGN